MKMEVVAIVGLGYVGLPLAVAFGEIMPTIGYDLSLDKIQEIHAQIDPSGTVSCEELAAATHLRLTTAAADLAQADFIIA
jgi:UDP-N-acetyl-D-galactosamine dehydrogenase